MSIYTVLCRYNAVIFSPNTLNRHPISHLGRRDMGCLLRVQTLLYGITKLLLYFIGYRIIMDRVITAPHCTYFKGAPDIAHSVGPLVARRWAIGGPTACAISGVLASYVAVSIILCLYVHMFTRVALKWASKTTYCAIMTTMSALLAINFFNR